MKYRQCAQSLESIGVSSPVQEAKMFFADYFDTTISEIVMSDPDVDTDAVRDFVNKRAQKIPLQYILKKAYFYNEEYFVDENCLIPRSDTEILVEEIIKRAHKDDVMLDLCTGSGCVAISVVANSCISRATALDISPAALKIAERNAEANAVSNKISFICNDIFSSEPAEGIFDIIVSNPPYIESSQINFLQEEVRHEPAIALDGGEDGMNFYRAIMGKYPNHLSESGFFAFEIRYNQAEAITKIAEEKGFNTEIIRDFGGNDRVAILTKKN